MYNILPNIDIFITEVPIAKKLKTSTCIGILSGS